MNCPRCGSHLIDSNKFETVPFANVAPDVRALHREGRDWMAGSTVFAWLAAHTVNALIDDWQCQHCNHTFTV